MSKIGKCFDPYSINPTSPFVRDRLLVVIYCVRRRELSRVRCKNNDIPDTIAMNQRCEVNGLKARERESADRKLGIHYSSTNSSQKLQYCKYHDIIMIYFAK